MTKESKTLENLQTETYQHKNIGRTHTCKPMYIPCSFVHKQIYQGDMTNLELESIVYISEREMQIARLYGYGSTLGQCLQ